MRVLFKTIKGLNEIMQQTGRFVKFVFVILLLVGGVTTQAQDTTQNIVYIAKDENPRAVLTQLLGAFGREVNGNSLPSRPVTGKFTVSSVKDIMTYFERSFKINWFEYGTVVYVYNPGDWRVSRVYVGEYPENTDWEELVKQAGLHYEKFSVIFSVQDKELIVSGPKAYRDLVSSVFGRSKPPVQAAVDKPKEMTLMVFPLKNAPLADRVITLRNERISVNGALTVLRELLGMKVPGAETSSVGDAEADKLRKAQKAIDMETGAPKSSSLTKEKFIQQIGNASNKDGVSVGGDSRTNSILIRDYSERYVYYKSLIDQLDQASPMIEVEATLVEVDSSLLKELGVDYDLTARQNSANQNASLGFSTTLGVPIITGGASSFSIVDPSTFLARLRALQVDQKAKVLAKPNIVTQNNIPAFIDLSQTVYLSLQGERVAEVVPITAGSLLQVTPRVVEDGGIQQIFLSVEIQDGSLTTKDKENPTVRNTVLSTQAVIGLDKALLVGGYNREENTNVVRKIPVLGSIPFIGKAFSVEETNQRSMSRFFLITPRLVNDRFQSGGTINAMNSIEKSFPGSQSIQTLGMSLKIDSIPGGAEQK
ncbi:type III secretion system outer membrane ring subunit SctC [Limnobacter sp.]|uniref:type III secretion system outer membrane ring subunit SctC n=1 Tax=Limnobacter sp. TaxID=2003368 RepID=UPI002733FEA8|nr:type III secretion system outer membrane ring subunit SctC [Limnobacter sp.]